MLPIRKLLDRIRWDKEFSRGRFELDCFDWVERRIVTVPFHSVEFLKDAPGILVFVDEEGRVHRVTFHRIRQVWKDSECLWRRAGASSKPEKDRAKGPRRRND